MKIAMMTTWYPPIIVGSGNRFYEIARRLSRKHEVHVYTVGMGDYFGEEIINGVHVHRFCKFNPSKSIEMGSFLLNLKFSLHVLKSTHRLKDFDIIDCNIVSKTLPYVSYIISKFTDIPLIETWHEVWHKQNLTRYNPVMAFPGFFMELFIPKLSDVNIAVSETTKRRLIDLLKVDPENVVVIPNGIDLRVFKQVSAKKKYGRILYAGRLESHKRVDVLIKAFGRLRKKFPETELVVVGTGPERTYLKRLSSNLNLNVKFLDPLPYKKLVELMKTSWIFVLPSIMEGQGIVLLEAMAAGTPPIAVKAEGSGVVDIIRDGYNGLLVLEKELEEGIERAIERMLVDEDLHTSLRRKGINFVKSYDWDKIVAKVLEVYEKVIK